MVNAPAPGAVDQPEITKKAEAVNSSLEELSEKMRRFNQADGEEAGSDDAE